MPVRFSFIVPFHRGLAALEAALAALSPLDDDSELIVAADGGESCDLVAARYGARVVALPQRSGPAVARNRAAAAACGDVLVFVDADVAVSRGAVARMKQMFEAPSLDAVFGAYDDRPADTGWMSQYKNLSHAFVHRTSAVAARTFWAGFGAVRRRAFEDVGGFDPRFERPCVEDIDLGYRLTARGYRIVLDPGLSCTHLKRWTVASALASDFYDRGIPWTQLMWRYGEFNRDLNLRPEYRWSVSLAWLAALVLVGGLVRRPLFVVFPVLLAAMTLVNWRFYAFFWRLRGFRFAARVWLLRPFQDLLNGLAFVAGTLLMFGERFGRSSS